MEDHKPLDRHNPPGSGIPINVEGPELRRVHICYYARRSGDTLKLYEISDVYYQHPDGHLGWRIVRF